MWSSFWPLLAFSCCFNVFDLPEVLEQKEDIEGEGENVDFKALQEGYAHLIITASPISITEEGKKEGRLHRLVSRAYYDVGK
ncbi:hypothetical protein Taro_041576 [Colocasia esculenta]|uniref:Uncharacterized protein n=1 Tax=Colocasia esculenta TaxID=4460 RepID=A0A843WW88_COLES|nr:hypothetical protein [Colocasia esculenta]